MSSIPTVDRGWYSIRPITATPRDAASEQRIKANRARRLGLATVTSNATTTSTEQQRAAAMVYLTRCRDFSHDMIRDNGVFSDYWSREHIKIMAMLRRLGRGEMDEGVVRLIMGMTDPQTHPLPWASTVAQMPIAEDEHLVPAVRMYGVPGVVKTFDAPTTGTQR